MVMLQVEGTCSGKHGYIVCVSSVDEISQVGGVLQTNVGVLTGQSNRNCQLHRCNLRIACTTTQLPCLHFNGNQPLLHGSSVL